jgi:hypothetical protein
MCVLHWAYTGTAPVTGDCVQLAIDIGTSWGSRWKALYSSSSELTTVAVMDMASSTGSVGQTNANVSGTRAGGPLPNSTCALINYTVAQRYRGGKGRTYWPCGTDTDLTVQGRWSGAFTSSVNSAQSQFVADILASAHGSLTLSGLVILSYFQHGALRATPAKYPVLSYSVNPVPGTQRRRNWG